MTLDARHLLPAILDLHDRIRASVVDACERQSGDAMSAVAHDDAGDTIYAVDKVSEAMLVDGLTAVAPDEPLVLHPSGADSIAHATRPGDRRRLGWVRERSPAPPRGACPARGARAARSGRRIGAGTLSS